MHGIEADRTPTTLLWQLQVPCVRRLTDIGIVRGLRVFSFHRDQDARRLDRCKPFDMGSKYAKELTNTETLWINRNRLAQNIQ